MRRLADRLMFRILFWMTLMSFCVSAYAIYCLKRLDMATGVIMEAVRANRSQLAPSPYDSIIYKGHEWPIRPLIRAEGNGSYTIHKGHQWPL